MSRITNSTFIWRQNRLALSRLVDCLQFYWDHSDNSFRFWYILLSSLHMVVSFYCVTISVITQQLKRAWNHWNYQLHLVSSACDCLSFCQLCSHWLVFNNWFSGFISVIFNFANSGLLSCGTKEVSLTRPMLILDKLAEFWRYLTLNQEWFLLLSIFIAQS